jgi:5-methylcytosine-specific restriction enzyme subunit McrC
MDGHALLFEMNALFEQYVARLVTRALAGSGYRVSAQGGHRDCLFEADTGRFRTKPDLIIWHGEHPVLVVDTKWKRMAPRIDDPKQGISQTDVYQLMAYSQLYGCRDVMLLYPHHGDLPPEPICTRYAIAREGAEETLHVATLVMTGPSGAHVDALKKLFAGMLPAAEPA